MAVAAAIIGAGVLGAGGAIGGAALSKPSQHGATFEPGLPEPGMDPAVAEATFNALLQFGVADPDILLRAGPLNQAIQSFNRENVSVQAQTSFQRDIVGLYTAFEQAGGMAGIQAEQNRIRGQIEISKQEKGGVDAAGNRIFTPEQQAARVEAANFLKSGEDAIKRLDDPLLFLTYQMGDATGVRPNINTMRRAFGISGTDALSVFDKEIQYRTTIAPRIADAQKAAAAGRAFQLGIPEERLALFNALRGQTAGMEGDFATSRASELARINEQYGIRSEDILRSANVGGYNPGRALGQLERERFLSADMEALNRALALIGGKTSILQGQIGALSGLEEPVTSRLERIGSLRTTGVASGGATYPAAVQNPLGAGVAQAVPAGILSAYDAAKLAQLVRGPAAPPPSSGFKIDPELASFLGSGQYGG